MYSAENTIGPLQQDSAFELSFRLRHPLPAKARACVVLLHGVGGIETNLADHSISTAMQADFVAWATALTP
jgi:predicted esterase